TGALVCTIEKANMIFTVMMEEKSLDNLGALVVDELHLLSDPNRGYLLELLLTKLRFSTATCANTQGVYSGAAEAHDSIVQQGVQIIGMSATLSNAQQVADWLGAKLYTSDFRPVPLTEHILVSVTGRKDKKGK
ncbi:hypothetical protein DUNSADRAFT_7640, partial [Dunaliella salina]